MQSIYVKGKDAIILNLPRPEVHGVQDHGYVSL